MAKNKKQVRPNFRSAVFERDQYRCAICRKPGRDCQGGDEHRHFHPNAKKLVELDLHHITSRDLMPNGGDTKENNITLCNTCHVQADGNTLGFQADDLYERIGSDYSIAVQAAMSENT